MIVEDHPPMPLLPKSCHLGAEGVESGGAFNFLKLTKFRGKDYGKSKFKEKELEIEEIAFP